MDSWIIVVKEKASDDGSWIANLLVIFFFMCVGFAAIMPLGLLLYMIGIEPPLLLSALTGEEMLPISVPMFWIMLASSVIVAIVAFLVDSLNYLNANSIVTTVVGAIAMVWMSISIDKTPFTWWQIPASLIIGLGFSLFFSAIVGLPYKLLKHIFKG